MNEELQKQLAALLSSLMAFGADAKQFAADQIPPLVAEKIAFGRVEDTLFFVVFAVACGFCVRWTVWSVREEHPIGIATVLCGAIFGFIAALALHESLMVWFAPRLYIVEWLKGMVTK